jgi:hypothetical protein
MSAQNTPESGADMTKELNTIPREVLAKMIPREIPYVPDESLERTDDGDRSDDEESWCYNEHKYGPKPSGLDYTEKRALWETMKKYETVAKLPGVADRLADKMKKLALDDVKAQRTMKGLKPEDHLVVQHAEWQPHPRMPLKVQRACVLEHERREEIRRMWKDEGNVTTYIPGSEEARKMKTKAKLLAKQMAKDELILKDASKPVRILSVDDIQPTVALVAGI